MKKLSLAKLYDFFAAIAAKEALYLPVNNEVGKAEYKRWSEGVELSHQLNTLRSAKDFFFPQTENLMEFKMEGKKIDIIDTREACDDFVIFGVRACDAASFDILDRVYLVDPVDSYYKNRREHGTVITHACGKPAETCFCGTFGIDAADPKGDITVWDVEDGYVFRANTEKGEKLMAATADLFEDTDDKAVKAEQDKVREILAKMPLADLTTEGVGAGLTKEVFDRPEWASLSESCLGCGTCTFVCPTCQCYDIRDFDTGHGIQRFRCWDSCMYSDFTKMSAGQPRPTQLERFRQRFMHKLVYFPDNNDGVFGCVGCGRCLSRCPISMNIVKVMKTLAKGGNK
ncbi:MAG: 4Fe-4S dicluster domain-containing protein [Clostridia bacterium]|nr:4Fe-4S dicluster domain-containing protein [Clostridia bacterium]MBQ8357583.1 4Fe-4S dicluster domain-containing protein [Clostridia bacterium]